MTASKQSTKDKGKHTPGPWVVSENETLLVYPSDTRAVFSVAAAGGEGLEEAAANVRLIAAAPELLEACQALLLAYRRTRPQIAGTDALEEQTRAALRKAGAEEHNG